MSEWKTIDSAPRDGRRIILYEIGNPPDEIYIGHNPNDYWPKWIVRKATHWMPLPEPPKA